MDFLGGGADTNLDITMGAGDFFQHDMGAGEGAAVEAGLPLVRKANKKQVQQIRQAMMKHDKKIQRAARIANREEDDEDDIVHNMTNLILNNKGEESNIRKAGLLALDTAANTITTNVMRSNAVKNFGDFGSKKLTNLDKANSMLMNPMIESFLTFNLN